MIRRMFLAAGTIGALSACAHTADAARLEPLTIESGGKVHRFQVEIADTDAKRQRGLMFRKSLPPDRGMLFIFPVEEPQAFWMKNTFIPLDIIYIAADGHIVSIARRTIPFSTRTIPSKVPARFVLEIAGGRAGELGVRPGDRVRHRSLSSPA